MLSFPSVAEAYRPDPPSPAGVNFLQSTKFMQLIYRSGGRHKVSGLRLKGCTDNRNIIYKANFKLSLSGTIKIFFIMCKLKDVRVQKSSIINHGSQLRAFSREHSTQPPPRCKGSDRNKLHSAGSLFNCLLLKI